ncbi:hypothetical protein ACQI4F_22565 [Mycolicibacterium vaccae]|uniref:hypothetical protein n=1 Tax=Mycolicibacterium vaccae TaxID=1810 RepID=UPI003CEDA43C
MSVLSRLLTSAACVAAAGAVCISTDAAQPEPPPPPPPAPNVNAYPPVSPKDYAIYEGTAYAFGVGDLVCMLQRSGSYGCNGPLPGAPNGANLVSGTTGGVPGFAAAPARMYDGPVNPLPPNTRLSFGTVSCGSDGTTTSCVDSRNQAGFVVTPAATWVVNATNPLLARPEGTNPFFN